MHALNSWCCWKKWQKRWILTPPKSWAKSSLPNSAATTRAIDRSHRAGLAVPPLPSTYMRCPAIVDWWKVFFFVNENWAHKSGSNLLFAERQHLISEWRNFKMFFLHSDRRSKKEESRRTRIKQVLCCHATLLHRWTAIVIHSMPAYGTHLIPSQVRSRRVVPLPRWRPQETMKLWTRETSANLWPREQVQVISPSCWVYRILNVLSICIYI